MSVADSLAPGFIIASPKLDESVFERSVILMIHHDSEGAMGFIINKPLELDFGSLLEMVELEDGEIDADCYTRNVYFGGPVRTEQLWVIANDGNTPEGSFEDLDRNAQMQFHQDWLLTGTVASIENLAGGLGPRVFRPYVGYAGWGPGQLETEISEGSWLTLDFDDDFVFDEPIGTMWDVALERMGLDEATFMLMGKAGSA